MILTLDYEKFHNAVGKMAFPTVSIKGSRKEFFGTSLICVYNNQVFILNAGHPLSRADDNNLNLFVELQGGYCYPLPPTSLFQDNGNMDIGISPIPKEEAFTWLDKGVKPFDLATAYIPQAKRYRYLIFFGYPWRKYNPRSTTPKARFVRFSTDAIHPPLPQNLIGKVDPDYHIVGTMPRGDVELVDEKGTRKAQLPKFEGMSGGPAFWYDPSLSPMIRFAGIGIRSVPSQYIAALNIEAIIAALNSFLRRKA